ncbi:MAG: pirin family protein [Bacteroidota bacterium]
MNSNHIIYKSNSRGHANLGWLDTYHTFSFSNYYNPERVQFGALRVLNDDTIEGGTGFDLHPHENMEIITIPLKGALEHKDSMGNVGVINRGDIQVMSAGTGIYHSEYNFNKKDKGKFLQIWILPDKQNVTPRYGQITLNEADSLNRLQQIVSPNPNDEGLWIHQQAWLYIGNFDQSTELIYNLRNNGNGVFFFIIKGTVRINGETLETRDSIGIIDADTISITASSDSEVLVIEVPMNK